MSFLVELRRRNVLRVAAAYVVVSWLVIQVVETIFPAFGFSDAAIRIVVIVFGIGLLPVLILAWAFEITPEGLKLEKDVDRSQSITPHTGKKLDRMIMVVLALALGYFAFDKFVLSPQRQAAELATATEEAHLEGRTEALVESYGDHSIAVLPFVDMSQEGDQEYFSDGIAEELLNLLAKIPELRVISRSSAFSYKGKDFKLGVVARELNVANILEGSVRKAGNQVRVTAQLIEARSDTHLWSETYDRPLDNIFVIQDDIAANIVAQLKVELLGKTPKVQETSPEAYSLFLQGRYLRRQTSADSLEQSQKLLEQVLEIDPEYLPAMDDLISVYINQAHAGDQPFNEAYEQARQLTLKGLAIDPDFARLHIQMGWIEAFFDGDMEAAARSYQRALTLDPTNTTSLGDTSTFLFLLGRIDKAIALGEYINIRDPMHPVGRVNQGKALAAAGRYEEAISSYRKALSLSPGYGGAELYLGVALLEAGDPEAALVEVEKESIDGYRLTGLAIVHYALANRQEADEALQTLIDDYADDWSMNIAQVLAFRGDTDAAFEWIDTAIEQGHPELAEIIVNNLYANLYDDPRWPVLLDKLGKSPEQLAAIEFEVSLPDQNEVD
jgi:adenylate cyclase